MGEIIRIATLVWHSPGPVLVLSFTTCLPRSVSPSPNTQNQDMALRELVLNTDTLLFIQSVPCLILSFINIVVVNTWCFRWLTRICFVCSLPVQASGAIHVLPQASGRHAAEDPRLLWTSLPREDLRWGQYPEWTQRPTQRGETKPSSSAGSFRSSKVKIQKSLFRFKPFFVLFLEQIYKHIRFEKNASWQVSCHTAVLILQHEWVYLLKMSSKSSFGPFKCAGTETEMPTPVISS